MRIAVFGLGYVGCVSAAAFAARGHDVVGVDPQVAKVEAIASGAAPIVEPGLAPLIAEMVASGRLSATVDAGKAMAGSDLSLVCVGTPSRRNGGLDTDALARVAETIGVALRRPRQRHTVVIRSTMLPGTSERIVIPALESASSRSAGRDFGYAVNPEFLREGSSLADFADPPKTVIGSLDESSADIVAELYEGIPGPVFRVPIAVAEMTKYLDNSFHALKVCFANEIGALSRAFDVDSHKVMEIFKADDKLNISPAYLTPGFAFGGSCLPKDVRALLNAAQNNDLDLPVLAAVPRSNEVHLQRAVDAVVEMGERRVGMFGLAFKRATDDLRESPFVELAERLIGKGFDLKIHDSAVSLSRLLGANLEFIEKHLPHISNLLVDDAEIVLAHARVLILGNRSPETLEAAARSEGRTIIDLVRLPDAESRRGADDYVAISW